MNFGIDYGNGQSNITESGHRIGIIPAHVLGAPWYDVAEPNYGDPTCPECGGPLVEYDYESPIHERCSGMGFIEYVCERCEMGFDSDSAYPDEPLNWIYKDEDYYMFQDNLGDVWVLRSPFYTHACYCSPCAPGAVHLESPLPQGYGPTGLCPGPEFFEDDENIRIVFFGRVEK